MLSTRLQTSHKVCKTISIYPICEVHKEGYSTTEQRVDAHIQSKESRKFYANQARKLGIYTADPILAGFIEGY